MFENYVVAKNQKRRTWKTLLVSVSVFLHAAAAVALIIRGFWVIEKLALPKREVTLTLAPPPPPPPPPPAPSKRVEPEKKIKKIRPMDVTQPVEKKPEEDVDVEIVPVEDIGVEGGVEGGVAGGVIGGVVGGVLDSVPGGKIEAPPPPPPPPQPQVVPQVAIEAQRIAGEKQILPDDTTKLQMQRDGTGEIMATAKMCLSVDGGITSVNMIKPSGYPEYDRKITSKMREWMYKPFIVNGKPVPVCTSVTFIYRQS